MSPRRRWLRHPSVLGFLLLLLPLTSQTAPDCSPVPVVCEPQCEGRECGFDGCDGMCGECGVGESCQDGLCVWVGCTSDAQCADGDLCNGVETCDPVTGGCLPGTPVACDDGDDCTEDGCDPATGTCTTSPLTGTPCEDGDPCTSPDLCDSGLCAPGAWVCGEDCTDLADNDGDGAIDCADSDCSGDEACAGDTCLDAIPVGGSLRYTGLPANRTDALTLPCGPPGRPDLVFVVTLAATADLHVDTEGSDGDTAVLVRGADCEGGIPLACNDDVGPGWTWSRVELQALPAGLYHVIVDAGDPGAIGQLVVNIVIEPFPNGNPLPVAADPLIRMPGTQSATLEGPNRCLNCHGTADLATSPAHTWMGSMMAQAGRDFLTWASMTVAAQDSLWALGRPNGMAFCLRCHFPTGWLQGRASTPNASLMTGADYDGVQCDICHSMVDPFFVDTHAGTRETNPWLDYWDETNLSITPSQVAADATLARDHVVAAGVSYMNGDPFFGPDGRPAAPGFTENGAGQMFVDTDGAKRASFADAAARHPIHYSRYHKSRYFCGTCHDVSNPVFVNLEHPGDGTPLPSETMPAYAYTHSERTFSEFLLSDFGQIGGAPGTGSYAPDVFDTSRAGNVIAICQDCHMRDVPGVAAKQNDAVVRPTGSVEHPKSGLPLHAQVGGNAFVTTVLASIATGSPNYDAANAALLLNRVAEITLDFTQGEPLNGAALLAGAAAAVARLQTAASIRDLSYDTGTGELHFHLVNHTGHKLISGFPEGRRMFVNIRAYAGGQLVHEVNPYDDVVGTLRGLPPPLAPPDTPPLGPNEAYVDELVYEAHLGSALTGEEETFHFVLATHRYKDNRIPPRGFRIGEAAERQAVPVWHGVEDPGLFSEEEYAGGYADVEYILPVAADLVEVRVFYQTTSREYVAFLRDQINGAGVSLSSPTFADTALAYTAALDPFFDGLRAWGNLIWELWDRNKNVPGAAPVLMTSASVAVP